MAVDAPVELESTVQARPQQSPAPEKRGMFGWIKGAIGGNKLAKTTPIAVPMSPEMQNTFAQSSAVNPETVQYYKDMRNKLDEQTKPAPTEAELAAQRAARRAVLPPDVQTQIQSKEQQKAQLVSMQSLNDREYTGSTSANLSNQRMIEQLDKEISALEDSGSK